MLTTTLSDFRKDTGVVIISLEEYNALKSTQHELSSRINQQRLDASIEALKSGKKNRRRTQTYLQGGER
jgi:antitoxin YefM